MYKTISLSTENPIVIQFDFVDTPDDASLSQLNLSPSIKKGLLVFLASAVSFGIFFTSASVAMQHKEKMTEEHFLFAGLSALSVLPSTIIELVKDRTIQKALLQNDTAELRRLGKNYGQRYLSYTVVEPLRDESSTDPIYVPEHLKRYLGNFKAQLRASITEITHPKNNLSELASKWGPSTVGALVIGLVSNNQMGHSHEMSAAHAVIALVLLMIIQLLSMTYLSTQTFRKLSPN